MSKQIYTWSQVEAGDIISFRYKGKNPTGTLTSLLVMNPKMPFVKKDGSRTFHLVGLKLESKGNIPTIKSKPVLVELLSKIGSIQVVSGDDQIYKILVDNLGSRGTTRATYQKIKRYVKQNSVYRTYDYREARKSRVFLEPISLPKDLREVLIED